MAEIVNLRLARERKARADASEVAAQNRVKFGRTKAERDLAAAPTAQAAKTLDGHERED